MTVLSDLQDGASSAVGRSWREEGAGADHVAVAAALLALLLGYLDTALQHLSEGVPEGHVAAEDMQVSH